MQNVELHELFAYTGTEMVSQDNLRVNYRVIQSIVDWVKRDRSSANYRSLLGKAGLTA